MEMEKIIEKITQYRNRKGYTYENMADELTTGNVAHKKAAIKGFAGRAKEFLIKHT